MTQDDDAYIAMASANCCDAHELLQSLEPVLQPDKVHKIGLSNAIIITQMLQGIYRDTFLDPEQTGQLFYADSFALNLDQEAVESMIAFPARLAIATPYMKVAVVMLEQIKAIHDAIPAGNEIVRNMVLERMHETCEAVRERLVNTDPSMRHRLRNNMIRSAFARGRDDLGLH